MGLHIYYNFLSGILVTKCLILTKHIETTFRQMEIKGVKSIIF